MSQPTTARLDLSIWRNDDLYELPIRVIGPNLTGVAMRAQIRQGEDSPFLLAGLALVTNGNAEGVRLASTTLVEGRWVNDVRIRINKSTRQALPYSGEIGDAWVGKWVFAIAGKTRIVGDVRMLAHTLDSDGAPLNRPPSYDSYFAARSGSVPSAGATLTIAADNVVELVIDGADLVGPLAARADAAAGISAAAAVAAAGRQAAAELAAADAAATLIAVRALTGNGPIAAVLPLPAVTRNVLAAFANLTAGQQAYLSEGGYEGMFRWMAGDRSALIASDPRRGVYVPPSATPNGSAGTWQRIFTGRLDWRWFGAVPDGRVDANGNLLPGATDNTAAIQACLDFNGLRGGGDVGAPDGIFVVRTPTVRNGYRAILHGPSLARPQQMQVCRIKGDHPASLSGSGSFGLILFAEFAGDGGAIPSVFGAYAPGPRGITYLDLGLEDAIIRQPGDPTCHGFDARYAHTYRWVRSRIDLAGIIIADGQTDIFTVPKPTRPAIAFQGSLNDIPYRGVAEDVVAVGFQIGIVPNELFVGCRVGVSACEKAVYVAPASHPIAIDFLEIISCKNGIVTEGTNHAEIFIGMVDIEHSKNVPDWIAVDDGGYGYDIDDPTNVLRGEVRHHTHASGFAQDLPFKQRGGRNLRVLHDLQYDIGMGSQEAFSRIFAQFPGVVSATSLREIAGGENAIPWQSMVTRQTDPAKAAGAWSVSGFGGQAPSSSDYRLAQISVLFDGNLRRSAMAVTTWRDGTPVDCIKWDSRGRMIFMTAPPVYANEAAARAADVPFGTLCERPDGTLFRQRLV